MTHMSNYDLKDMQPPPPDILRSLMIFKLVQLLTEACSKHRCRVASMLTQRNEQVPAGEHMLSSIGGPVAGRHHSTETAVLQQDKQQGCCKASVSVLWCLPSIESTVDEPLPLSGATLSRAEYADMYYTYVLYICSVHTIQCIAANSARLLVALSQGATGFWVLHCQCCNSIAAPLLSSLPAAHHNKFCM